MKRFFLNLAIGLFVSGFSHAQVEKGYKIIGGTGSIGFDTDEFVLILAPNMGWFVKNKFAIGGQMFFYVSNWKDHVTGMGLTLMPFARYYIGKSKTKFFLHGGAGFEHYVSWWDDGNHKEKNSSTEFKYDLRAGMAHFIADHVALEVACTYSNFGLAEEFYRSFGITAGFQIHIFKNKE